MDIAVAADRNRIPEMFGNGFHGNHDVLLELGLRRAWWHFTQGRCGDDRSVPGPEILCSKFFSRDIPDVVIDVCGIDRLNTAVVIYILKQFITGKIAKRSDNSCQAPVFHRNAVLNPALPTKEKTNLLATNFDMTIPKSRESIGAVLPGIFFVSNAHRRRIE